ncbi:hypothetical protein [Companilactobacillus furfuricola]|nr:hypothetical protein [Companilactobacillus furfuricola]
MEVVFWLLRSMPTPGPGDTATGTLPAATIFLTGQMKNNNQSGRR